VLNHRGISGHHVRPSLKPVMSRSMRARAAATETSPTSSLDSMMDKIKEDSKNMFSDKGMDISVYADGVEFRDPITKYDSAKVCSEGLSQR
jgi:Uncharacterized conserved protein (DUF2358)